MKEYRQDILGDNGNKFCEYFVDADGTQYIKTKNTSIKCSEFFDKIINMASHQSRRNKK